jgi:putative tryptophan/tyrosine transport system substrate-binding protein
MLIENHERIVALAAKHRLPDVDGNVQSLQIGGLVRYSSDWPRSLWTCRILSRQNPKGREAGELPIQQPTKFRLIINLNTAKSLGLTVPPTLLASADEVSSSTFLAAVHESGNGT